MIEDQLASPGSRPVLPRAELDRLSQAILKADLSIETMSQAAVVALNGPVPTDVKGLAGQAVRNWVRGRANRMDRPSAAPR